MINNRILKKRDTMHLLQILLITLFLSSCSMSKTFLYPSKLPKKDFSFSDRDDKVIYAKYAEKNHQLIFTTEKDSAAYTHSIESVVFQSKNGNKLNGWMLKPKNKKIIATILHFHGSAGNLLYHHERIAPLVKEGFQIFTFDYSEFGYSEGKATRKNVLIDANSALDYIKQREDVKGTKLIIYGQSYGGHTAALIGTERQNEIEAMVIEGGFSSHREEAVYKVPFLGNIVKQGKKAKKEIKKFHKPLLIIHSNEDKVVPLYLGKRIFDNANQPKTFFEVDKSHLFALKYYAKEIANKIIKMLH